MFCESFNRVVVVFNLWIFFFLKKIVELNKLYKFFVVLIFIWEMLFLNCIVVVDVRLRRLWVVFIFEGLYI